MTKLSIIIPAKNEEKRISRTLSVYGQFFSSHRTDISVEIIVVINDSDDSTSKIVDDYVSKYSFIKKIETSYASGKGGAVALGFKQATGDFIGFTDADGAVSPSEFYRLFCFLEETPWLDGTIGTRIGGKTKMSPRRRFLAKVFNLYVKFLFNLQYSDTQCGAKIFLNKKAKLIADRLSNTGWAFDVNLLLVAKYLNLKIVEFPVSWVEKEGSKFSIFTAFFKVPLEFLSLKYLEVTHALDKITDRLFGSDIPTNSRENILIFSWRDIKHPDRGGSELYIHEIAKRLAKKHNVTLFTTRPGNLSSKDIIDGVRIHRKGNYISVYFWAFVEYMFHYRDKVDFVIDVQNGIPFFTPLYSKKPKLMILHHVHKNQWFRQILFPFSLVGYFFETFVMPLVYRNTQIVTVSPSSTVDLKKLGFKDKNIFVAYNSINTDSFAKGPKSETPLIAYIGRVKAYKRLEVAITCLKSLKDRFPGLRLVIGGTGDHLGKLEAYADSLGVADKIDFLGYISEKKKWEYLQKAWVFLMPSIKEGWGITIIEAAHCGTPSVGFNVLGVRDSIRDNLTGFLAKDEQDFVSKVDLLLKTKKLRNLQSAYCKKWADFFSWNTSVKVFEKIIEQSCVKKDLLSTKVYPWDLDSRLNNVDTLLAKK